MSPPLRLIALALLTGLVSFTLAGCGSDEWPGAEAAAQEFWQAWMAKDFEKVYQSYHPRYSQVRGHEKDTKSDEEKQSHEDAFKAEYTKWDDEFPDLYSFAFTLDRVENNVSQRAGIYSFNVKLKWKDGNPLDKAREEAAKENIQLTLPAFSNRMRMSMEKHKGTWFVREVKPLKNVVTPSGTAPKTESK